MKNVLLILLVSFYGSSCSFAQADLYQKAMKEAITKLDATQSPSELQKISNTFNRIASRKKTEWLPLYYQSLTLTRLSFTNKEKGDELADEANKILNQATPLAQKDADKAELKVLQGFIYVAKLVVDPMTRGQKFSAMSSKAYGEALKLDPTNPRAKFMSLQGKIGTAQFFKQDITPFIKEAKKLLKDWDTYKPASAIHPNWGKEMVGEVANGNTRTTDKAPSQELVEPKLTEAAMTSPPVPREADQSNGFTIQVKINGLRNDKGVVLISLQDANKAIIQSKSVIISDQIALAQFTNIAAGTYAIKYIHDENEDGKINFGFMHIPKEGFGYANDARGKMGPPDFSKTTFTVTGDTQMELQTKYL